MCRPALYQNLLGAEGTLQQVVRGFNRKMLDHSPMLIIFHLFPLSLDRLFLVAYQQQLPLVGII